MKTENNINDSKVYQLIKGPTDYRLDKSTIYTITKVLNYGEHEEKWCRHFVLTDPYGRTKTIREYECVQIPDESLPEEDMVADFLRKNRCCANVSRGADDDIAVEIVWGDWKHDHIWCETLMRYIDYETSCEEIVTEENGSDSYSAIHYFHKVKTFIISHTVSVTSNGQETKIPINLTIKASNEEEARSIVTQIERESTFTWKELRISEANKKTDVPVECDFYSIEPDPNTGDKYIHIHGYTYKGDPDYKNIELGWCTMMLSEFIAKYKDKGQELIDELTEEVGEYEYDTDNNGNISVYNSYYNGNPPTAVIQYEDLTMDTPCGDYAHIVKK